MIRASIFVFCASALLSACTTIGTQPVSQETAPATIEVAKSPNDDRAYRYVELENGLKVLLVSDPDSDKSAAALAVFRGSMHDPEEHPGLAHFLEHMLFIGTEKYPDVDGYQQFIGAGGGSSNAYTAHDHTNYFFDIGPDRFDEALDRFAQFFISPLFSEDYVEREKNAVNSEYQLQIKDDSWRANAVEKVTLNPAHPASRFNIGSLETLGDGVQEALLEFFEQHYSADQMSLVVLDTRPLDELAALVQPMFAQIPNRQVGPAPITETAYEASQLPVRLDFVPIKDQRTVSYQFPTPSTIPHWRSKPEIYISNLLGHEGKGSLLQALKARGWVNELFARSGNLDADESTIQVTMTLTEAGAEHLPEISGYLFAFIDLLRAEAPMKWRFDEQALVASLGFQYLEKQSATATVYQLAPAFMHAPPQEVIRSRFLMEDFSPALITDFLHKLTPENVVMSVQLPNAQTDQAERWFDVQYRLKRGALEISTPSDNELAVLALPKPNPFLPENLQLADQSGTPAIAIETKDATIWQHLDVSFGAPKANLRFNLHVDGGMLTPADIAAGRLYQRLVGDALNEFAYATLLGGISYRISALAAGFRFDVSGYNDKQLALLERILETFATLRIDPARFDIIKTQYADNLNNAHNDRPYNQAYDAVQSALMTSSWPPSAIAEALDEVTVESLTAWRDRRLAKVRLFGLVHGNVAPDQGDALHTVVKKHFQLADFDRYVGDVVQLDTANSIGLNVPHNDAAYVAYVQDADDSWRSRAMSSLAVQFLRQSYFTSLRTEQQLGYVVAMVNRVIRKRGGIGFIVQSPVAGPDQVMQATTDFLSTQASQVGAMDAQEFAETKHGLLLQLLQADKNLAERTGRYWGDLVEDIDTLDSRQRLAAAVEAVTQEELTDYVAKLQERLTTESLVVFASGQFEPLSEHGQRYDGIVPFKEANPL